MSEETNEELRKRIAALPIHEKAQRAINAREAMLAWLPIFADGGGDILNDLIDVAYAYLELRRTHQSALAAVRREGMVKGLEEAMRVAEYKWTLWPDDDVDQSDEYCAGVEDTAKKILAGIRALVEKPDA